nr:hypothetical protein BgiMline_006194 [Biomphalaria glabrata]
MKTGISKGQGGVDQWSAIHRALQMELFCSRKLKVDCTMGMPCGILDPGPFTISHSPDPEKKHFMMDLDAPSGAVKSRLPSKST